MVQGRRRGVFTLHEGDGTTVVEKETFTCGHCQHLTILEPGQKLDDVGAMCRMCMRPTCAVCCTHPRCDVFEKKLARAEARAMLRAAI